MFMRLAASLMLRKLLAGATWRAFATSSTAKRVATFASQSAKPSPQGGSRGPSGLGEVGSQIDRTYKLANARDRQVSATILKTNSKDRLFKMYQELIKHPRFNTTHLVLIFARLIDVELYLARTQPHGRAKLKDQPTFYRILDDIEQNVDRMLQESLATLLKKIAYFQFFEIDYSPIIASVCAHLSTDEVVTVIDKFWVYRLYFYLVRLNQNPQYREVMGMQQAIWRLVKETQRYIISKDLPTSFYFALAKYHALLPMTVPRRAQVLNKELMARKKWAAPKDLYYWMLFNSKQKDGSSYMELALGELINKQGHIKLTTKKLVGVVRLITDGEFEGAKMLKGLFLKDAATTLKDRVAKDFYQKKITNNLGQIVEVFRKVETELGEIVPILRQIMLRQFCNHGEDLVVLQLILEKNIQIKPQEIQEVADRGKYDQVYLPKAFEVNRLVAAKCPDIDLTKFNRLCMKLAIRKLFYVQDAIPKTVQDMKEIWTQDPISFTFYLYYLVKAMRQFEKLGELFEGFGSDAGAYDGPKREELQLLSDETRNEIIIFHAGLIDEVYANFDNPDNRQILGQVLVEMRRKILVKAMRQAQVEKVAKVFGEVRTPAIRDFLDDLSAKILVIFDKSKQTSS